MKAVIFSIILGFSVAPIALADTWIGNGQKYDHERNEVGAFDVKVEIQDTSESTQVSKITVTDQTGVTSVINCTSYNSGDSWSKSCDNGQNGGGYYFNNGLAQEYTVNEQGQANVVNITFDSRSSMRILVTILQDNDAIGFVTQTLQKSELN